MPDHALEDAGDEVRVARTDDGAVVIVEVEEPRLGVDERRIRHAIRGRVLYLLKDLQRADRVALRRRLKRGRVLRKVDLLLKHLVRNLLSGDQLVRHLVRLLRDGQRRVGPARLRALTWWQRNPVGKVLGNLSEFA